MVFAWLANIVALVTILRVQSLRNTPHNTLILNLTVADLGRALLVMPFSLKSVLDGGEYLTDSPPACKIVGFFTVFFIFINFITVAFIAIDRVIVVTSCNKCNISDWTRVRVMVASAWLIAASISLLPTLIETISTIKYIEAWRICGVPPHIVDTFNIFTKVIMLGIVLPTMVVSYTIIAVLLWKRDRKLTRRRRRGLRSTIVARPAVPVPTSPVGFRKVTFDMRVTIPDRQSVEFGINEEQPVSQCLDQQGYEAPPGVNSFGHASQDTNRIEVKSISKVEDCDASLAWNRNKPIKRNRKSVIFEDRHQSAHDGAAPVRYGLGARLSALLNIKKEPSVNEDVADGEEDNCVIKGFKSAHGTGFTPGTSIYSAGTGEDDTGTNYRTVIETRTRRLSHLFGSLKGIVGLGHYGREDDDDDEFTENYSDRDDEQTCDIDSEPSQTMTTHSMSPSMVDCATGKDDENMDDVVRSPRVRRRNRKTKLEKLRNIRQRRVALTGVLLVCCNIVFSLPLAVWSFFDSPADWYGVLAFWLTYCVTIADPMVYAFMNRRVKKELKMYRKTIANSLPCKNKEE
ncbi:uncharacterized protein LOC105445054 [Strongylocentrotus purpuratus]|uniref:G-protein coupled receptors family 1 profile domain-containing protein n=1 Tax=Strongylocentrotus purpuratus TaxID=7668 RepID=A0A7M7LTP5_STRPU|nr:uncharacterized protein LOC105445054 [Strongylocentrotus purpuratus]